MFKTGDRVRCVRGYVPAGLEEGKLYRVALYVTDLYLQVTKHTAKAYQPSPDGGTGLYPVEFNLNSVHFVEPQVILKRTRKNNMHHYLWDADRFEKVK